VEVKPGSGWTLGFIIVECTVCGSKDKTKPSREGLQGTVDVTISRGPGEALTRGLPEMGEPTSVGLTYPPSLLFSACTVVSTWGKGWLWPYAYSFSSLILKVRS